MFEELYVGNAPDTLQRRYRVSAAETIRPTKAYREPSVPARQLVRKAEDSGTPAVPKRKE